MSATVHWLGTGLSSLPGLKRLAASGRNVYAWNRSLEKAQRALGDVDGLTVHPLNWEVLTETVKPGDVLVSMLPATMHVQVAELCLQKGAHFVSSSYISPDMQALHQQAVDAGLSLVNEVGLDPGLDHLFAHLLVEEYRNSPECQSTHQHAFRSYCGGFPKQANDFKYKFSWSPLGVLKALKSPARWIADGQVKDCQAPWEALSEFSVGIGDMQETFQAYPNRDSTPFIEQYHFDPDWQLREFVRGTLRLNGWAQAWQPLFEQVSSLQGDAGAQTLKGISDDLESKYSYETGEADRVVLFVELEVSDKGQTVWHRSYGLDLAGNEQGQAMARLVSYPVSLAVEAALDGKMPAGVSAAPSQSDVIRDWLDSLNGLGEHYHYRNHLA